MPQEKKWLLPVWLKRENILDHRSLVYYLILNEIYARYWAKQIEVQHDGRFFEIIAEYVEAYVNKGERPPEEIATAIINIADDFIASRDIVLRAGDYITLKNFIRKLDSK